MKGGKVTREPKVYTSRMSFLLTVGFLKVGNQPTTATGNANARCGKCKPCTSFEPSVPFPPFVPSFLGLKVGKMERKCKACIFFATATKMGR